MHCCKEKKQKTSRLSLQEARGRVVLYHHTHLTIVCLQFLLSLPNTRFLTPRAPLSYDHHVPPLSSHSYKIPQPTLVPLCFSFLCPLLLSLTIPTTVCVCLMDTTTTPREKKTHQVIINQSLLLFLL